jgi:hypothetical protein
MNLFKANFRRLSLTRTLLLASVVALLLTASVLALVSPKIPSYKISSGGTSSSGSLTLSGSFAQHDAREQLTGGAYKLTGGLWGPSGASAGDRVLFLPYIKR